MNADRSIEIKWDHAVVPTVQHVQCMGNIRKRLLTECCNWWAKHCVTMDLALPL